MVRDEKKWRRRKEGAFGHCSGAPIWGREWSRCDHSARAERAARGTTGPRRPKPARRSTRRYGSQREPFRHRGFQPWFLPGQDARGDRLEACPTSFQRPMHPLLAPGQAAPRSRRHREWTRGRCERASVSLYMARRANQPKPHRTAQAATPGAILIALVLIVLTIGVNSRPFLDVGIHLDAAHSQLATLAGLVAALALLIWVGWATAHNAREFRGRDNELSRLALVAHKTESAVLITDANGLIQWVNEGLTRITGHAGKDAVGEAPRACLSRPVQHRPAIQSTRHARPRPTPPA